MRFPAIGTDGDLRPFRYDGAAPVVPPADTHQPIVLGKKILDKESLSQLCAGINSRIDQEFVEHAPPRSVAKGDFLHYQHSANQGKVSIVGGLRENRRTI
jgi:hypothetical protein